MITQVTHPDGLTQLAERIDALEKRVGCLEQRPASVVEPADLPAIMPTPSTERVEASPIGGALTIVGKALLGIAGAYVLRALSGSGVVPRTVAAALAAAYALGWLFAAARTVSRQRLAGVLYAATSILILAPMLWEMTLRFRVMPPWAGAGILAAYAGAATLFSHRSEGAPVFSAAFAGCALTSLALAVGTHDMVPFAAILLAMLVISEFGVTSHHARVSRVVVALAADLSLWALLFVYRASPESRPEYPAISIGVLVAAPLLLFAIQAAVVIAHTGFAAKSVTVFEAIQSIVTLLLATCGIAWFLPGSSGPILGAFCLALSAVCYVAGFARFRHAAEQRNFRVFTAWACALLVAGFYLWASPANASACMGCVAVAAMLLSRRLQSAALAMHGVLFVVVAAGFSGLLQFCISAIAGQMPLVPSWPPLVVAGCALLQFGVSRECAGEPWPRQLLHLIPASLAACVATAFLTRMVVSLAALVFTPDVFHIALFRTLVLCVLALSFAFGGARLGRAQMIRVAYVAMYFVAAKLLFEDLRHGRMEFIAGSICLVALTLIAVPRLARRLRAS